MGSSERPGLIWRKYLDFIWIVGSGLVIRILFILRYPAIYGGDPIGRLVNSDHILLAYQLPLFQSVVYTITRASDNPTVVRLATALIGALSGWFFFRMARHLGSEEFARLAALIYALHPFLIFYSIVPYQESLMLLLVFAALDAFFLEAHAWLFVVVGMACLVRYETWIVAAVLGALDWRTTRKNLMRKVLFYGWVPLLWIVWHSGISPAGTYVLQFGLNPQRWERILFLGRKALSDLPWLLAPLMILGIARVLRERRWKAMLGGTAIFLLVVVFAGHDYPVGTSLVTEREAHWLVAVVCLLAGMGMLFVGRGPKALVALFAGVVTVGSIYRIETRVYSATHEPNVELPYEVSRFLNNDPRPTRVLAPPLPQDLVENYLQNIQSKQAADRVLSTIRLESEAYQRLWVQAPRARAFLSETMESPHYIVIFPGYVPRSPEEDMWLRKALSHSAVSFESRSHGAEARVYRVEPR